MTRGNQREIDRARAQARAAKHAGKNSSKVTGDATMAKAQTDAERMREKQRISELKKQGIFVEKKIDKGPVGPKGKPIQQKKVKKKKK